MASAEPHASSPIDIAVVGGGLVGSTVALALGQVGFRVALIDREPLATQTADAYDGRASAIALGSKRVLAGLGVWSRLAADAGPILDIRVSDGPSRLFLHYDHRAVSDEALGYIVENRHLRRALADALAGCPLVVRHAAVALDTVERDQDAVALALSDGTRLTAALMVGADGRGSRVRDAAGIALTAWRYPQTAIVCSVRHERPHRAVAHERFLAAGPFALLPLKDQHRASIVWTESNNRVDAMMALDDAGLSRAMTERFGDTLGALAIDGRRWTWPLGLHHAERYVDARLVLVGDAAHGIHPIAGQGLNLGLRDVAALAEVLVDARRLGLDVGDQLVLERYQRWRRPDNVALLVATDGLNRLFTIEAGPVRLARDLGLAVVNRLPPLKQLFMRHAMGLLGDLPRLTRGQPL
ncbi:MAG: UbiH/UbiF/VisC/COQ6 family ubiquinone biosynthesis hydroxylase [Proteobacteria bacterium]|nr:UbiH/UbiF/VisC/COQ6 family ubiquinone biosynthesis hydroxylase [Pseudomonadota bacterium]